MSAEIEVIIDSEPIYSIDINTVDEIFEITTLNIQNIYEIVVIEPTFFSSSFLDDSASSPIKTYSSNKIETIVTYIEDLIDQKQDVLSFKTINSQGITGEGNIEITAIPTSNIKVFTSSGAWVKPPNVKFVRVLCIGGGGGGGSGRVGSVNTVRCGGGGGGAGSTVLRTFNADTLSETEQVIIGAGGNGGVSKSANDTDGSAGSDGGSTYFGGNSDPTSKLVACYGRGGGAGTQSSGASGAGGCGILDTVTTVGSTSGSNGSSASTTGGNGTDKSSAWLNSIGGASGGGITSANVAAYGGISSIQIMTTPSGYGVNIGAQRNTAGSGDAGGDGVIDVLKTGIPIASGGNGGATSLTKNSGKGGNGINGSGGGGGGASLNGFSSGAGGNGGDGICIVWSW